MFRTAQMAFRRNTVLPIVWRIEVRGHATRDNQVTAPPYFIRKGVYCLCLHGSFEIQRLEANA
jgi:hypothetical protein